MYSIEVRATSEGFRSADLQQWTEERGGSVRLAPLLLTEDDGDGVRSIAIGEVAVGVDDEHQTHLNARVIGCWRVSGLRITECSDDTGHIKANLEQQLADAYPTDVEKDGNGRLQDPCFIAAAGAKAICELSRNSATVIREIRYGLESRLADESAGGASGEHTSVVAAMLKLNIMCGRITDVSRHAVREGLYTWITDDEAYHGYRSLRDPTLFNSTPAATVETRNWMRLHDTAMRQCEALMDAIAAESATLVQMLAAASSISSSRDADAQTRLNTLVALLSIGIGVPALVLTMYSTELLLPLQTGRQRVAFVPIFLSLLFAAILAIWRAPKMGENRRVWFAAGVAVLFLLAALVVGAVIIVTHPLVH